VTKNELKSLVLSELNDFIKSKAKIQVQKNESVDEKVNPEIKRIYKLLLKYGNNQKDAMSMINKNLKYVNKTYRNSTPRGKAIALVGLQSLGESMTKSQIKNMRDEFNKTGELPSHLKKFVKAKKEFEKKFKVKDIVVPGLEWMSKIKEDMKNTSSMMKSVRKGPKVGPWDIIVSKNNKIVKRVLVKNLKELPAEMSDLRDKYPNHVIGIESKAGKIVYREGTCGYGVDGKLGEEPAGSHLIKKKLLKSKKKFDLEEACQKGYMTHPTRKTKIMFGKRYRNCVKKEGVDTTMTMEQAGIIADNICVNCGDFTNENLRKWFSDRWVNIGKKKKGGGHPPCGTSGKKRGYAKCVPASKAAGMSKKQKASATRRKRAAQNKAGRGGTSSLKGGGKKPIRVSTKPKK